MACLRVSACVCVCVAKLGCLVGGVQMTHMSRFEVQNFCCQPFFILFFKQPLLFPTLSIHLPLSLISRFPLVPAEACCWCSEYWLWDRFNATSPAQIPRPALPFSAAGRQTRALCLRWKGRKFPRKTPDGGRSSGRGQALSCFHSVLNS